MADVSITASSVVKSSGNSTNGTAGATITAGQPLYKDSTDANKLKVADASAEATAAVVGIALHGASPGQPIEYLTNGVLTVNSVLTASEVYCLSATAGGIAPVADLLSTQYRSVLGVATSATTLKVTLNVSGTAK